MRCTEVTSCVDESYVVAKRPDSETTTAWYASMLTLSIRTVATPAVRRRSGNSTIREHSASAHVSVVGRAKPLASVCRSTAGPILRATLSAPVSASVEAAGQAHADQDGRGSQEGEEVAERDHGRDPFCAGRAVEQLGVRRFHRLLTPGRSFSCPLHARSPGGSKGAFAWTGGLPL